MAEPKQYLRMSFAGSTLLLPSTSGYTIEQRENMMVNNSPAGSVAAWRTVRGSRWPAFVLDEDFKPMRSDAWERAVFIEALPHAYGVMVDDVHLLPRSQMQVTQFTPLGASPIR